VVCLALALGDALGNVDVDPKMVFDLQDSMSAHPASAALLGAGAAVAAAGSSLAVARILGVSGSSSSPSSSSSSSSPSSSPSSSSSPTSSAVFAGDGSKLPTTYNLDEIRAYWGKRPLATLQRGGSLVARLSVWAGAYARPLFGST